MPGRAARTMRTLLDSSPDPTFRIDVRAFGDKPKRSACCSRALDPPRSPAAITFRFMVGEELRRDSGAASF